MLQRLDTQLCTVTEHRSLAPSALPLHPAWVGCSTFAPEPPCVGVGQMLDVFPSAEPTPATVSTASGNRSSNYHVSTQSLGKALFVFPMCQGCN